MTSDAPRGLVTSSGCRIARESADRRGVDGYLDACRPELMEQCRRGFPRRAVDHDALIVDELQGLVDLVACDPQVELERIGVGVDLDDRQPGAVFAEVGVQAANGRLVALDEVDEFRR